MGYGQYSEAGASYRKTSSGAVDKDGNRVREVMSSFEEVAHLWAAQSQSSARYRDMYFSGATLYSYGSHFIIGIVRPDVILMNAESYSLTTSRHQQAASYATNHRDKFSLPELTELAAKLDSLESANRAIGYATKEGQDGEYLARRKAERDQLRKWAREYVRTHAAAGVLGASSGAYVLRSFGLAPTTYAKLKEQGERQREREKAAEAKARLAHDRKAAATLADMGEAEFLASYPPDRSRFDSERQANPQLEMFRAALAKAHKVASAAGWERRKAIIWRRLKAFKAHMAGVQSRLYAAQIEARRAEFAAWKAGGDRPNHRTFTHPELAAEKAELEAAERAEHAERSASEYAAWKHGTGRRPNASDFDPDSIERREIEESIERDQAHKVAAWRAGAGASSVGFLSDAKGGALLRIKGDTLETSHGASVPLEHAIRAFRFVKLVRQRGELWTRNGKQIRVGHYQIDAIQPDGSFKAGCHSINWPEIERAAIEAGVFDSAPDESAVERKEG